MYKIEKTDYGFCLAFVGFISKEEISAWRKESEMILVSMRKNFHVIVDLRFVKNLSVESKKIITEAQSLYRKHGMVRSSVIFDSKITAMQFRKIARESGIFESERYIDVDSAADWKERAVEWVVNQKEPNI